MFSKSASASMRARVCVRTHVCMGVCTKNCASLCLCVHLYVRNRAGIPTPFALSACAFMMYVCMVYVCRHVIDFRVHIYVGTE